MTWLLWLYPRRWRVRYGAELVALVREQRWTPSLAIDLVAGAIDARLHAQAFAPPRAAPTSETEGESRMVARLMKLRCAGYGPEVTPRDQWMSVVVMIGGTLVLTLVWFSIHITYGDNPYVDAFSLMPFLMSMLLSLPLTTLKGRSRAAQALFVLLAIAILFIVSLAVGFITSRM